jgi:hypothetical protein
MKVHVVLNKDILADPIELQRTLEEIVERSGLGNINQKRLARHGLLTGSIAPDRLAALKDITQVSSVEIDSEKFATSSST